MDTKQKLILVVILWILAFIISLVCIAISSLSGFPRYFAFFIWGILLGLWINQFWGELRGDE